MGCMPTLDVLRRPAYPRSAQYDFQWQVDLCMGPNPLWLLEELLRDVELRPGMRVLDLGCGMGMTSVFLAREYGVQVVAADHWIAAADNQRRFDEAGVSVDAVDAEAHALPFREEEFDAIVSIGSYHYFGTDDLYLGYVTRFLKPGGVLAVASVGSVVEAREVGGLPEQVRAVAGPEGLSFHTAEWWRFHWEQTRHVAVTGAWSQPDGCAEWLLWCEVCAEHSTSVMTREGSAACIEPLREDGGSYLTMVFVTATRL